MRYLVKDSETNKTLFESFDSYECDEYVEYEDLKLGDFYIQKFFNCRTQDCEKEGQQQSDAYGISTGYWCHECYNSEKYPYKKERYATIEHHGYGERLEEDY